MTCFLRNTFLGILFLFFILPTAQATHIIGGEMNYACLGNDQYEIFLTVYRDCDLGEALLDDTAYVAVYDMQGLLVSTVPMLLNGIDTVTQAEDCFLSPEDLCIETTTYRDTITLTPRAGGYHIAYQRCCRNATILNIVDPLNTGTTYDIILTEAAMMACNTSPKIKAWPPTYICVNRPLLFDHSATDGEGDSLAYKLCTPLDGGISLINPRPRPAFPPPYDNIRWRDPIYSLDNLLGGDALTIDPSTGVLTGTPATIGQFVVGVCVEEYRNGQMISETRRDFQYNVIPCQEISASFDPPQIPCENFNIELKNTSIGATDYLWKFLDGNRVLGTSEAINPSFIFPEEGSYTIRLIVDRETTCVDSMDQIINLKLEAKSTNFSIDIEGCQDSLLLQLTDLSSQQGTNPTDWRWTINGSIDQFTSTEPNPSFIVKSSQSFDISLVIRTENNCFLEAQKETNVVVLQDATDIGPPDTINTCGNTLVELNPDYDPTLLYDWSFHPEIPDPTIPNPIIDIDSPTKYLVNISDSTGLCQFDKVVVIDTAAFVSTLTIEKNRSCDGQTITFQANQKAILSWDFGDGQSVITRNNAPVEHTYSQVGEYEIVVTDITPGRCKDQIILPINTIPLISPDFTWSGDNCTTSSIELSFTDQSIIQEETDVSWFWELSDGRTATGPNPVFEINDTDTLTVKLTVSSTTNPNCIASTELDIPTLLINKTEIQDTIRGCVGEVVALNPNPSTMYEYDWSANTGIDLTDPNNPIVTIEENKAYQVSIRNEFGCVVTKIVNVEIVSTIEVEATQDFYFCEENFQTELFAYSEQAQQQWWLNEAGDTIGRAPELTIEISNSEQFTYIIQDKNGCSLEQTIEISNAPIDLSYAPDLQICQADTIQLTVINNDSNRPLTFNWSPEASIFSGTETNTIIVSPSENTSYEFLAIDEYGCEAKGTILVSIQPIELDITVEADNNFIYSGETIGLVATENTRYTYDWTPTNSIDNPTSATPIASPTENTTYQLTVTSEIGCTASASVAIEVEDGICDEPYIFLPNAFTPDGDGENDILYLRGAIIGKMELVIYDRWGDEIFKSFSPEIGWDGTKRGKAQPSGVFGYYIYVECVNGEEFYKQGNVSLIR